MTRRRVAPDTPLVHRIASILLRYPDAATLASLADVTAALPAIHDRADRERLAAVAGRLRGLPPTGAEQAYVVTFDHTRRRSLHLTYYRHGDTRARGMALLALKHAYRQAGHRPPDGELPDFLPLILEFAAVAPEDGHRILLEHRAGLELLRQALRTAATPPAAVPHAAGSPPPDQPPPDRPPPDPSAADAYAAVLDVVCGRLPVPGARQRALLRRLAADGPPREEVGLEPFAPPAYLTTPAHHRSTEERR